MTPLSESNPPKDCQSYSSRVAKASADLQLLASQALASSSQSLSSVASGIQESTTTLAASAHAHAPKVLKVADEVLDIIPFGSLVSNAVNLGLKNTIFNGVNPKDSHMKEYIEHIQNKDTSKCLLYSIPFAGNAVKLGTVMYNYFYSSKDKATEPPKPTDVAAFGLSHEKAAGCDTTVTPRNHSVLSLDAATESRQAFSPTLRRRVVTEEDVSRASTPSKKKGE